MVLHTISKFDEDVLRQANTYIVKGLLLCLNGPLGLRNEMINSPDFWSVLQGLHAFPETTKPVFDIVNSVVDGPQSGLTTANYEPVVSLLGDVATAGTNSAILERKRQEASAKAKAQQPKVKQ